GRCPSRRHATASHAALFGCAVPQFQQRSPSGFPELAVAIDRTRSPIPLHLARPVEQLVSVLGGDRQADPLRCRFGWRALFALLCNRPADEFLSCPLVSRRISRHFTRESPTCGEDYARSVDRRQAVSDREGP